MIEWTHISENQEEMRRCDAAGSEREEIMEG